MAAETQITPSKLAALIEQADFAWEKYQLPVSGEVCIAIPCRKDEVEDVIAILFETARQIDNQALRSEMFARLSTLQSVTQGDIVRLYWPDLLISDSAQG